jgi:mono/diheme cytochrome c family protein
LPASEENLIAGAKLYRQMCSRCHGVSEESDNGYGQSFYPPAPHLPTTRTSYTDSEIFWVVKHGIRNTAMPAWGNFLSDDEIWHVVTLVRKFDSLPDSATSELFGHRH